MTDEERLAKAKQLVDARKATVQIANSPDPDNPNSITCYSCRYWDGFSGRLAECKNQVASLQGSFIREGLRGKNGLCGPNALYWEYRTWWPFIRIWEGATGNRLRPNGKVL